MRRFRRRYSQNSANKLLSVLVIIFLFVILLYVIISLRITPIVKTIAVNNARNLATQTINNAAGKVLKNENINYDKLMTIEKDESGKITAIKANTIQIDQLKYEITDEALKEIKNIKTSDLGIPVGTIIGGQMLTGEGPEINVKIEPVGSVETQFVNEFSQAGINQTRQQIRLKINAYIAVIVSSYNIKTDVTSDFAVADTVIVGSVPDSYTVVGDDKLGSKSDADKIFTYGGNKNSSK